MKGWQLLVATFLLWPCCSSQNACEEPDEIDFGEIVSAEKAKYLENDRVQYRCNPGYVLEGPEWIQCKRQEWTPHPPKCLAPCTFTKQQLAAKNLFVFGSQRKVRFIQSNQSLQFQCNEGYVLVVPSVRKCVDGYMDLPLCISERGKNCSGPPRIENGDITTLSEKQYKSGSSVEFRCQNYYAIQGEKRSFCDNGTWTKVPVCLKTCLKPSERDFTFNTTKSVFLPGDELHYECKEGFEITKNTIDETIVCTEKGWEPAPSCVSIVCEIPFLENGAIEPREDVFHNKAVVHFKCNKGFTRVGSKSAQCYHFGWFPQPAICKENVKHCLALPIIPHSTITAERKAVFEHGDLLEVQCDISFALYGSKVIECVDGEWTPLPTCIEESKTCGRPPRIDNGFVDNVQSFIYRHGDTVEYTCNRQYSIIGTNPAKCLHGQWEVPSCLRNCPPPPQLPNAINIIEMRVYGSGEEISLECQEHFLLRGPQKIKCEDGKWQTPPRCLDLTK
ncbi:complement factor H-like isoform X2 [Erythrolamprus reginae]|uniref:complement factor H-like isoform X2 n=1 Tax=Erythrolamprus reginae TaxID=121349 RepID=UPI00396CEEA3